MAQDFGFKLLATDGAARLGEIATAHGSVRTPAFMPIGTQATVKGVHPAAVRATGADVRTAAPLVRALQQLGMPLYQCQPPTGYKDTADAWVNTGALVNRMNFAVSLTSGQLRGLSIEDPSAGTALTLGSPEFQRK